MGDRLFIGAWVIQTYPLRDTAQVIFAFASSLSGGVLSTSMSVLLVDGFCNPWNQHSLVVCREANIHCSFDG